MSGLFLGLTFFCVHEVLVSSLQRRCLTLVGTDGVFFMFTRERHVVRYVERKGSDEHMMRLSLSRAGPRVGGDTIEGVGFGGCEFGGIGAVVHGGCASGR